MKIDLIILAIVVAAPLIVVVVSHFKKEACAARASAFADGYLAGWRDCRDDRPPKDFP